MPDMRSLGAVFAILVLAFNASPTDPGSSSARDATIVLQYGNSTQVNSDLRVAFAQVVDDSRCPASVVCVWQGNGAVRLDITTGRGAQSVTLNTAGAINFPNEASAAGYTFTLLGLDPQRQTTDAIPPQQYRATIRVTRAE
jgi:beta-galactosidase/beta-glucuronidase